MRQLLTIITLFSYFFLNAQSNDSLAVINFQIGKNELFYGKYNKSIDLLQKSLDYYKSSKNYQKVSETHNLLSQAYNLNSRLDKAFSNAQDALINSRKEKHKNRLEEINALVNIGRAEVSLGQLNNAEKNFKLAEKINLEHLKKNTYSLANIYYNLGAALRSKAEFKSALEYLNKALDLKLDETKESKILLANIYEGIGFINYDLSDFDAALSFFEKTFDLATSVYKDDNPYLIKVYNDLGLVYSIKEQFNHSLEYYKKAVSISVSNYGLDRHPDQARLNFNIGTIYRRQNQKTKALFHTEKSLNMALRAFGENHRNLFFPYSQMGQIYNNEEGITYLNKALKISENSDNPNYLRISYLYDYFYEAYTNIKNYPEALNYAKKALKLRSKIFGENNVNTIRSHNIVSKSYIALNDFQNALSQINIAIDSNYLGENQENIIAETIALTDFLDDDLLLESIKTKADIYLSLYKKEEQKELLIESQLQYNKATSLINLKRNKKRNYEDKIKFSGIVKSIYAKNIETRLLLNTIQENTTSLDELFYFSEKSRANVLREIAKNSEIKKVSNIDSSIVELERSINFKISKLASEVIKESTTKSTDSSKLYALEGELFDLSQKKDSLEKTIELNFPKYYSLKYQKKIVKLSELQEQLNENTTVVEFFSNDKIIYAFIITKKTYTIKELSISNLENQIQELNKSIVSKNQSKYLEVAYGIYDGLIHPIKNYFTGNNLIIIPDEALWNLQFDLLITKENSPNRPAYLLYDYAVSYANSASMLFENIKNNNNSDLRNECIAFSYSETETKPTISEVDLPGTRKEISELSKIIDGQYFYNDDANEANFKTHVNKYKLVHLALHAEIDSLNTKNIKILFSEGEKTKNKIEDNKLYSHELYGLNIPAKLVALSACNTGVGKLNKGEGILSLGNAFQYAGAESLLLSRWKISDETTPEVMKLFYKNLKIGLNKSEALQQAKIQYLNTTDYLTSQPLYWGSFYILGNPEPINLGNSNKIYYYIGFGLLLATCFFFLRRKKHS